MAFRRFVPALLLAATFAVPAAVPARAADLDCEPIRLTCSGFEPNWLFELPGDGTIRFTDPENPDWETRPLVVAVCSRRLASGAVEIVSAPPLNLSATVRQEQCVEPDETVRPLSIDVSFVQGAAGGMSPAQVSGPGCCR